MKNVNVKLKNSSGREFRRVWVRAAGSTVLDIKVESGMQKVFPLVGNAGQEFRVDVFDSTGKYLDSYTANLEKDSSGMIYESDQVEVVVPYSPYDPKPESVVKPEPVVEPEPEVEEDATDPRSSWRMLELDVLPEDDEE